MIKSLIRKSLGIALSSILLASPSEAKEVKKQPTGNLYLTALVSEESPITRAEALFKNLPLNSDVYLVGESKEGTDLYKFRTQTFPIRSLDAGIAIQHTGTNKSPSNNEIGITLRKKLIQGKTMASSDIRYFPESKSLDGYFFISNPKIFGDCLWKVNTDSGVGFIRPGIDYKLNKNFSLGLETKFSGKLEDAKQDYLGIRGKATF